MGPSVSKYPLVYLQAHISSKVSVLFKFGWTFLYPLHGDDTDFSMVVKVVLIQWDVIYLHNIVIFNFYKILQIN